MSPGAEQAKESDALDVRARWGPVYIVAVASSLLVLAVLVVLGYLRGRDDPAPLPAPAEVTGVAGGQQHGRELFASYGCDACHSAPTFPAPVEPLGPPLTGLAARETLRAETPNTPENLLVWIMDPRSVDPESAMPDLDVTLADALDIVAFLYGAEDAVGPELD